MTQSRPYDVVCVGNALVDIQSHVADELLTRFNLNKGDMQLVDAARAATLYAAMSKTKLSSGGSGANSIAVLASLGGKGGFIGRVGADQLGAVFAHDLKAQGVDFAARVRDVGAPTGSCLVMITGEDDKTERTMCTSLGCNTNFSPADLDEDMIRRSKVLLLEGYLFDQPGAKAAFRQALAVARDAGTKVALTLSAEFCVKAHREDFLSLIHSGVDILFANEKEITALYQASSYDEAVRQVDSNVPVAVITHGPKGAMIRMNNQWTHAPAEKGVTVVDPTGAGDAYAGGFLHAYTQGKGAAEAGRVGAICAAEVISHDGARPEKPLAGFVASRLQAA
jgi:sugar/nucleoside kinase (ribokinase family)